MPKPKPPAHPSRISTVQQPKDPALTIAGSTVTRSQTKTWSKTTTTITKTVSTTVTPLSSPQPTPRNTRDHLHGNTLAPRQPSLSPLPETYAPPIPHPDSIQGPEAGDIPEGYYVVLKGQEVGIFYHWDDVANRIRGVGGNIHRKYATFQEAVESYRRNFKLKRLQPCPVPGGDFWPTSMAASSGSSPTASSRSSNSSASSSSASSNALWEQLEDLSEHFSQVTFD